MKIKNSIAVVTGANRGIGRALVEALLATGARKIYATSRDLAKLDAVRALDPMRVVPVTVDVTEMAAIDGLARAATDATLLFNNAGVLDFGGILDVSAAAIKRNFDTNFLGTLNTAKAFVPVIESNGGGAIVNVLTLVALASMPGLAIYNASKAASWSMTQALRASVRQKNIEVFGVFPGAVDTEMLAGVQMPKTKPLDVARATLQGIEAGDEDVFPDPMSQQVYAAWKADHKAVEKQFASL